MQKIYLDFILTRIINKNRNDRFGLLGNLAFNTLENLENF
jgi:hypothetical protein